MKEKSLKEITEEKSLNETISQYKKMNKWNSTVIIALLVVLLIVCAVAIYVRLA